MTAVDDGRSPSGRAVVNGASDESPPQAASIPSAKPWPLCAYAPGGYTGRCHNCGEEFEGDKRALECLRCAAQSANWLLSTYRAERDSERRVNASLQAVFDALEGLLEVHDAMGAGQSVSARRARAALAQAIEARRAETAQTGSACESAAPQECAQ